MAIGYSAVTVEITVTVALVIVEVGAESEYNLRPGRIKFLTTPFGSKIVLSDTPEPFDPKLKKKPRKDQIHPNYYKNWLHHEVVQLNYL